MAQMCARQPCTPANVVWKGGLVRNLPDRDQQRGCANRSILWPTTADSLGWAKRHLAQMLQVAKRLLHMLRCMRLVMAPTASSRGCCDMAAVGGTPDGRWTWPIPTVLTPSRHGWSEECRAETFGGGCRRRPCSISTYTLSYPRIARLSVDLAN